MKKHSKIRLFWAFLAVIGVAGLANVTRAGPAAAAFPVPTTNAAVSAACKADAAAQIKAAVPWIGADALADAAHRSCKVDNDSGSVVNYLPFYNPTCDTTVVQPASATESGLFYLWHETMSWTWDWYNNCVSADVAWHDFDGASNPVNCDNNGGIEWTVTVDSCGWYPGPNPAWSGFSIYNPAAGYSLHQVLVAFCDFHVDFNVDVLGFTVHESLPHQIVAAMDGGGNWYWAQV